MVAAVVNSVLNKDISDDKFGFVLLVFNHHDGVQLTNYVSNCSRDDTIGAMKEVAARLEAKAAGGS
jgi:hypothetical protein